MDDAHDPKSTASEARVGAKRAFMESLDGKLVAAGYPVPLGATPRPPPQAVRPPVPAIPKPSPAPPLTFEGWAELSVRFAGAPAEDLAAALAAQGLTLEVWKRFDGAYARALSDDVRAGQGEPTAVCEARYKEERARRDGTPAEGTPPAASTPGLAPAHLRGTNGLPDLPAEVLVAMGRMPFVPPAPAPELESAAPAKRAAKTVESKVMPSPVGGQTMDLDAALQRPTPDLPFAGSTGGTGVVYVPSLDARQYVALRAELALQPAPREETWRRYYVPNEAALRALEEQWRHPARRVELEAALADFAVAMRGEVMR
jgi:hypothetical protein